MAERNTNEETRTDGTSGNGAPKGSQKKAAAIVLVTCVVVAGAIVALNGDSLSVRSDVQAVPEQESEEEAAPVVNSAPEILSVTPASDRIAPFDLCDIVCEAVDPDGDELAYTWTSTHGDIYGEGSVVEWGSPIDEGLYRVTVSVDDGRGGVAEYSTSLRVKANSEPSILELTSDVAWAVPGSSVFFSCVAEDLDDDEIAYEWEATGGEVHGTGSAIIWLAPEEEGSYWVTVRARDAYGGESLRAMPISVTHGEPPTIGEFIVKGVDTEMVRPAGDAWKIFRGRTLSIQCVIEDGEGPYEYEWSVDRGTLEPDGDIAIWEAPDTRVSATIVVDVTDAHGNAASASALIYVETCTCAFG